MPNRTCATLTFFVEDPQVDIRIDTVPNHGSARVVHIGLYDQTSLNVHCDDEWLTRLRDAITTHLGGAA